jgi:hypothetical protein
MRRGLPPAILQELTLLLDPLRITNVTWTLLTALTLAKTKILQTEADFIFTDSTHADLKVTNLSPTKRGYWQWDMSYVPCHFLTGTQEPPTMIPDGIKTKHQKPPLFFQKRPLLDQQLKDPDMT